MVREQDKEREEKGWDRRKRRKGRKQKGKEISVEEGWSGGLEKKRDELEKVCRTLEMSVKESSQKRH